MLKLARCAFAAAVAASLAIWTTVSTVSAQGGFPDKPVHLIVAFVPGGATDTFARQIAPDLQEALGQPVVIENKPGAGGYIAWNYVASANPDGYTLLLAENAVAISQALYKRSKSSFDPLTQYDAVAGLAAAPSALIIANNVPAKTIAELVAHSKSVPQKLNFASAGIGSVSHLNFEVFMDKTGMQAVHVPYKGGGQAIGDVIAGHVPMTISSVQATKGLVDSGKVKALAVTSAARSPAMPNVPTMQEAGVPAADVELRFWFAVFGPKGMPEPVKAKVSQALAKVMGNNAARERLAKLDITPDVIDGQAMRAKLEREIKNWTRFIDAKGIKAE
ncbi:MAG: tripartite tricarboxylate transporter substrate binding protein [Xanthobacteraceae bacterium]|nr:tripartite tricarboxylate transporter substrate binding protein [Xanthobacteraceae bacterium]